LEEDSSGPAKARNGNPGIDRQLPEYQNTRREAASLKNNRSAGVVSGDLFVAEVAGTTVLVVDDLLSTGGTLVRRAKAARRAGARRVIALVTHGLFMPGAAESLGDPSIERLIITDSVPPFRLAGSSVKHKIEVLDA